MKKSELHALFNFTEADLEANRNGMLSEQQTYRLTGEGVRDTGTVGVILVIVSLLVTVAAHLSVLTMLFFDGLVVIGCVINALAVLAQYRMLKARDELLRVKHSAGRIDLRVKKSNSARNMMTLEGEPNLEFKLNDDQLLALRKGEHYNVYYLSNPPRIVAIEPYSPLDASDPMAEDSTLELEAASDRAKKLKFMLGDDGEVITEDVPKTQAANSQDWPATPWG